MSTTPEEKDPEATPQVAPAEDTAAVSREPSADLETTEPPTEGKAAGSMSFLDHLEELRRRLIKAVIAVLIFALLGYWGAPAVFRVALGRVPETTDELVVGGGLQKLLSRWMQGDEVVVEVPVTPKADAAAVAREQLNRTLDQAFEGDLEARAGVAEAISDLVAAELRQRDAEEPRGRAELIVTTPAGAVITKLKIALFVGIFMSVPIIAHQAWMFVAPGLMKNERRVAMRLVLPTTLCFALGVYFSYRILPLIIAFFSVVAADLGTEQRWIADDYLSFVLKLLLVGGCSFQLPVVSYGLASMGLIGPATLRRHRRVAVVIILIAAAAFTPPDPLSMFFMGLPLMVLYEISILVAALARRTAEES